MATKYYAVLTNVGAAKLANATALGAQVEITQMAVGDGNGVLPTPNPAQTALVHELRRKPLNSLSIDPNNANQIIAEQVIPEDEGGWWIREIGLFDKDGDMIAVANCAETYKPQLQEGSGRVQVVRMILIVSSTAAVTLKIDPSVVLATRQYVDDQIIQVKSYVDQKMAAHVAAADPHKQYAPKESPALTGRPTAPTAEGKDSSTQIANTAFVQAAIAALVGSSPEALDTLNELAAALGNDPNFATTVTNSLAGKMDKSANGSDIENVSVFLQNLGISAPGGAGLVGIGQSTIAQETPFVSPEMYGAGDAASLSDTQPLIDAFATAKTMGVSVKLKRLYRCNSNIMLTAFISDVVGLGQGQTGIIFESGFGFVVDNSAISGTRKAMRILNTSIRTRGNLNATAIRFTGTHTAKYGEQLKLTDVLFATDETGEFGWDCNIHLDQASQVFIDHCSLSGLTSVPTNCCIRLTNQSRDVNFTNSCASDFNEFMDVTGGSEGVTVAFNHVIAGRRGIVSHDTGGNSLCVIGNHFNTSLSVVELGEGTGDGSNHCEISNNFCIVFDHPLDSAAPYTGFDICSNYNQLSSNQILLTGFTKPNVVGVKLRRNTSGSRAATNNTIANPYSNNLSQGVVIEVGAANNQIYGNQRVNMTLANDIVDDGTNTRYWLMDSDNNSFLTGDIKLHRVGTAGTRQIRVHTTADSAVADGIIRFLGGTAGVANDGVCEVTFRQLVTKLIRPSANNTYTCGDVGAAWSGGFTQTAFTVTSDERSKANLTPFVITSDERRMDMPSDSEDEWNTLLDAWGEVGFFMYQFSDRVEKKGEEKARWHFGVVAQRIVEALTKHGLRWDKYAFICYDEWEAEQEVIEVTPAVLDNDGNVLEPERVEIIQAAREAGNKYGIRYEEALILEAAWQRRNYQGLLARIEVLEAK